VSGYEGFDVVETKDDNVTQGLCHGWGSSPAQDVTPIDGGSGYYLLRPTSGTIG